MASFIEIIFLAAIAIFIFSRLFSVIGITEEDDVGMKKSSNAINSAGIKDVTKSNYDFVSDLALKVNLKKYLTKECSNNDKELDRIYDCLSKIEDFDPSKFLNGAKCAFKILVFDLRNDTSKNKTDDLANSDIVTNLVDKRCLKDFKSKFELYKNLYEVGHLKNMDFKISDAYFFSKVLFIKVVFYINEKTEEWVFSKHFDDTSNKWMLININDV